ncbi:MAG: serine O-acetyltransferase [Bacilli bacterium]|nr:serine O-acetyltransferase [Bacilli bacterium]
MIDKSKIINLVTETICCLLSDCNNINDIKKSFVEVIDDKEENADKFIGAFVDIKRDLLADLDFFMESDPAIDSREEVILTYPGFKAICFYRIAHVLRNMGYLLVSRIITEEAHSKTGIDIHPGSKIAAPFFIDHGTGIVIGETAIVGSYVKLYQCVTLGALSLSKGAKMKNIKRHPTIGNHVTIYACASILGDITVGDNVTIGSNVFLIESVPPRMRVTIGKPELVIKSKE